MISSREYSRSMGPSCVILGGVLKKGGPTLLTSKVEGKTLQMEGLLLGLDSIVVVYEGRVKLMFLVASYRYIHVILCQHVRVIIITSVS
jgi:hypothetical protein